MNKVINIFVLVYIDACVFVICIVFICIFHVFAYCVVCEYAGCMQGACYSSVKEIGLDIQNIVTSYIVLVLNFRNCCNTCIGVLTALFCTFALSIVSFVLVVFFVHVQSNLYVFCCQSMLFDKCNATVIFPN